MTHPLRFAIVQMTIEPVAHTVEVAVAAEQAGFDSFWLGEGFPYWRKHDFEPRSLTSISAVIAQQTDRIAIGWGIVSPFSRHPIQIAMEGRTFQELAGPGRFMLGLGASRIFMRHMGPNAPRPLAAMREAAAIVRGVLSGEPFQFDGEVFGADVPALSKSTESPREMPPLYMAGTGPKMQQLAGEIADGLITASITTPDFIRWSADNLAIGASRVDRDPSTIDLGGVIMASIDEDPEVGARGAREIAAMYLANKVQNIRGAADTLLAKADLTFDEIRPVAEALDRKGLSAAVGAMTDEVFTKVRAVAGSPDQCIRQIEEYVSAGARNILLEVWGENRAQQVALFGSTVLPHFQDRRDV